MALIRSIVVAMALATGSAVAAKQERDLTNIQDGDETSFRIVRQVADTPTFLGRDAKDLEDEFSEEDSEDKETPKVDLAGLNPEDNNDQFDADE